MKEYSDEVLRHKKTRSSLTYCVLGLAGEAGELANHYKKVLRDDAGILNHERRTAIIDELGDVLWYVAALSQELGIDLDTVATRNAGKLAERERRGTIQGDGDSR